MKIDLKRKPRRPLAIDRIETLEARALMAATVMATYGGNHDLYVTLDNGQASTSAAQDLTINAQQYLDGLNGASFSGRIVGPTGADFDSPFTHNGNARLEFVANADGNVVSQTDFSVQTPSPENPARNQVSFTGVNLPLVANQINSVKIDAIRPLKDQRATPFPDLRILVDTIRPTVTLVGPVDSPRDTKVSTVTVTTSEPVQLAQFTFADLTLTRDGKSVPLDATVTVSDGGGSNRYTIGGLDAFTAAAGTYVLTVNAGGLLDAVGNAGQGSGSATFTFDPDLNVPPAIAAPDLQPGSDTGFSQTDNITSAPSLAFDVGGVGPGTTIRLLRDGVLVGSRVGPGSIVVASAAGSRKYTTQQVGTTGTFGRQSAGLTVVSDATPPVASLALDRAQVTLSGEANPFTATTATRPRLIVTATDAPANPENVLFAAIFSIDGAAPSVPVAAPPAPPGQAIEPLTLPSDLAPGSHMVQVIVRDAAGNAGLGSLTFTVLANPALATPGTPVFSTIYDINAVEAALNGQDPSGGQHADDAERPWSMAFDRTTQTVFAVVRGEDTSGSNSGGNRVIQLDPATGKVRAWNLEKLDPNSGPHGTFFDYESHQSPRIWFTQRTGDLTENTHAGRLSYIDLATDEVVTYDLRAMLRQANVTGLNGQPVVGDLHAVVVDRRGVAWASDEADGLILELDTRGQPDGLNTRGGTLVIHRVPNLVPRNVSLIQGENVAGPHGLDVVIDDRDGSATVYYASLIEGRFNALRPADTRGRAVDDPARQVDDKWYSWDIDELLRNELLGPGVAGDVIGAPLFPTIDNNETPDRPEDDFVYFGDPGFPGIRINGKPVVNNVIRRLTPGDLRSGPSDVTSEVKTWHIPPATAGGPAAQINQTFVDRDGTVFFIDRQGSVGRLDPTAAPGETVQGSTSFASKAVFRQIPPTPAAGPLVPIVRRAEVTDAVLPRVTDPNVARINPADISGIDGLDRYALSTATGPNRKGDGAFRGALSAGSVVFGSLTQGDQIGSTIFAEEARRETSVVVAPDGSRKVFQTLRDGRIVLTERDAGGIVDRQSVLTRPGIDPTIEGDVAAVVDAAGVVTVFGRDETGGMAEYRFDPATRSWTSRLLGHAATNLASDPQPYLDPARGAAALATTTDGRLVAVFADNGEVVDITARAGAVPAGLVYSKVGVVVANGVTYAYGTNQKGDLIEYTIGAGAATATSRRVPLPTGDRSLMLFQDLEAVELNGTRHVFGTDGSSRLVHVTIRPDGSATAENVTELTKDLATGYSAYQQPFAARVYGGANPVVTPDGEIYVYGTNGRDLVEFRLTTGGEWSASDLTNLPANRVFGNPSAYVTANGDRHVLLINEDGEMIEYYKLKGLDFATSNLTLSQGNSTTNIPGPTFPNSLPGTPTSPSADDHANLPGFTATPLDLSSGAATASGRIGTAGDRDVFRFLATRTGRVVVDLKNFTGRGFDPVLLALAPNRRRIASNDNISRKVNDSRVSFRVVAGQTYYIVARGKVRQTGDYGLLLRYTDLNLVPKRSTTATARKWAIGARFDRPLRKSRP